MYNDIKLPLSQIISKSICCPISSNSKLCQCLTSDFIGIEFFYSEIDSLLKCQIHQNELNFFKNLNVCMHIPAFLIVFLCFVCEGAPSNARKLWKNIEPHLKKALKSVYLREVSR